MHAKITRNSVCLSHAGNVHNNESSDNVMADNYPILLLRQLEAQSPAASAMLCAVPAMLSVSLRIQTTEKSFLNWSVFIFYFFVRLFL